MIRPRPGPNSWRFVALLVVVLSAVFWPDKPAAAQFTTQPKDGVNRPFGEQTNVFRRLLFERNFKAVSPDEDIDPLSTIVVWLGHTTSRNRGALPMASRLVDFMESGGTVLLATDTPLAPDLHAALTDWTGYVVEPAHYEYRRPDVWARCYKDKPFCPFLVPLPNVTPNVFNAGVGAEPLRVATNVPSSLVYLGRRPSGALLLAKLPAGCISDQAPRGAVVPAIERPFMIAWQSPKGGRLLLLADHSIFINEMMLPTDTGNVEFTDNCMTWLGDGGKRKKVLFIEEGAINATFDVPVVKPPPPSIDLSQLPEDAEKAAIEALDKSFAKANGRLQEAERDDDLNLWINSLIRSGFGSPVRAAGVLLVVLTLVGLVAGLVGLVASGFRQQNPVAPSLARLVQHQEPTDSLMEQRNQAMFQVQNFWEAGRQLARQTFEAAGVTAAAGTRLPAVTLRGSWSRRRQLRRLVARLWCLAFGAKPMPVPPSEWPGLLHQLDELRAALANGSVRPG